MKIVFLTRLFYPHLGGVEKHVFEISKRLVEQGHNVTIVTEQLKPSGKEKAIYAEIEKKYAKDLQKLKILHIPAGKENWFKKFRVWKWMWRNKELFYSADVIHAHDVFFWYLPLALTNPMKSVYTTFHGYETIFPPRRRAMLVRKISEYMSNKTICIGEYIKKWYHARPSVVMYGGVTPMRELAAKKSEKLRITFLGRIEEDNGIFIYNEVLSILSNNNIPFIFTAVGDGSQRKVFERWGDITGFTENTTKYIQHTDIIFSSSYLSMLEAFSLNKPVFAVYQNELKKDYLQMTPFAQWIVSINDPMKLSHEVIKFVKKKASFNESIEKAHHWALNQTWDTVTEKYLTLWKTKNI